MNFVVEMLPRGVIHGWSVHSPTMEQSVINTLYNFAELKTPYSPMQFVLAAQSYVTVWSKVLVFRMKSIITTVHKFNSPIPNHKLEWNLKSSFTKFSGFYVLLTAFIQNWWHCNAYPFKNSFLSRPS